MYARRIVACLLLMWSAGPLSAADLKAVGWNLESGESSPSYLAELIGDKFTGIDLWGFSEVQAAAATKFAAACGVGEGGQSFLHFMGTTGGDDRLLIVYNATKLELVEKKELKDLRAQTGRAPLYGQFKVKATGEQFLFMVNHLHRGSPAKRMEQTKGLKVWAADLAHPAVLVGDYNYDVRVADKKGNAEFQEMVTGGAMKWVQPSPFVATHKGHHNSVLDFTFLTGAAHGWTAKSAVVVLPDHAIDNHKSSDHRPVLVEWRTTPAGPHSLAPAGATARVNPPEAATAAEARLVERQAKRNELLKKITAIEQELNDLKRGIRELVDD